MKRGAFSRLTGRRFRKESDRAGEFTPAELDQLQAYLRDAAALEETRFVETRLGLRLNLRRDRNAGVAWSVALPPVDDLLAFLHRLRPLVLEPAPAGFLEVRKLVERALDEPAGPLLPFLLDLFQGRELHKLVARQSGDPCANSGRMLSRWLDAGEPARAGDEERLEERLRTILPGEWSHDVFVSLLIDKARAILALAAVVQLVVGERQAARVEL